MRYYTQSWGKSNTHGYAQRTRFLTESVLPHFVEFKASADTLTQDETALRATNASIRAGVRGLWS